MENKTLKKLVYIFVSMVGFGIGFIAVSMFISVVDVTSRIPVPGSTGTYSASLSLFDADWDSMDASPVFMIISLLVLLVGLAIMAVDASVKQKKKKNIKGLNYVALAISVVGLVLLIVSVIITKSDVEDSMSKIILASAKAEAEASGNHVTDEQLMAALKLLVSFKVGTGAVMAIIGGVIAVIGSVMLVVPALNPIKLAAAPAQPTESVQPTAENTADLNNNNNDTVA
ncbi:MAG: hypothetical protein J1G01_03660 [Clostridiales bacterium]|nr:hypothetical protein [Clostridiales bacterium]